MRAQVSLVRALAYHIGADLQPVATKLHAHQRRVPFLLVSYK